MIDKLSIPFKPLYINLTQNIIPVRPSFFLFLHHPTTLDNIFPIQPLQASCYPNFTIQPPKASHLTPEDAKNKRK